MAWLGADSGKILTYSNVRNLNWFLRKLFQRQLALSDRAESRRIDGDREEFG